MRVFVTGATGFVGTAVVEELLAAGHEVLGLARSERSAAALIAAGAKVHRGDLGDLESLRTGAAAADATIHLGFNHDFSRFVESCQEDAQVIETLGAALTGRDGLLLVTSGTAILPGGTVSTEATPAPMSEGAHPRTASEHAAARVAERGAKVAVVRLSPSVHGAGDRGFVSFVATFARQHGRSAYVGKGLNRWCAVHRRDAARLFRLALEKGEGRACYHAVSESAVPFRDIAAALGRSLDLPVEGLPPDAAGAHFDWFTALASSDTPASSDWTRTTLGWHPTEPGLLADIESGLYCGA
ncbi:3-beta hydroxysteroid dehydrogenase [Rhizobium sp. R72]|uniref:SDR family oxidoreductase n=1 Tax=unclassified Rhizobium TaxID=2613769 RepID=UPI000B5339F4|nr:MULTISPECIES: SDR family oxidoreductase [unclassified Rhizobium]OWV92646.1 3-beta hydroxysteroid dehydrogenase [Rhizobium sp. R72]OWV92857.1 3-beta hydroxysteroid dehydrogenase [Rhizobium sp. R711]